MPEVCRAIAGDIKKAIQSAEKRSTEQTQFSETQARAWNEAARRLESFAERGADAKPHELKDLYKEIADTSPQ